MDHGWLIPIITADRVTFGADRLKIPTMQGEQLRKELHLLHPRLLLSFKSRLLLSDDDQQSCGSGSAFGSNVLGLDNLKELSFEAGFRALSHCGETFFDRLLSPEKALQFWREAEVKNRSKERLLSVSPYSEWIDQILHWWLDGYRVFLLKEE